MNKNRIVIWGTGAPSLQIYYCINDADKNSLIIMENNKERRENALNFGVKAYALKDIALEEVALFIIPTYGINQEKHLRRQLVRKGLQSDRILVISPKVFRMEMAEHKSLSALIEHRKNKALYINSLEFEVAHHCNLNCKGCNHFSSLSQEGYADLSQFSRDLERILGLVDHVGEIRLLGGEPLLNPQLYRFIEEARRIDPLDPVEVWTNGLLLLAAPERLFDVMKECRAAFMITVYPPVRKKFPEIKKRLDMQGVKYKVFNEVDMFNGQINPDGDSDPELAESVCFSSECHIFENGFLTKCSVAHKLEVYLESFGLPKPEEEYKLDLYDKDLDPQKLTDYLLDPIPLCRYCGRWRLFNWEQALPEPFKEDWYCSSKY